MVGKSRMALLNLDIEKKTATQLFERLSEIDYYLGDWDISWDSTKKLIQERNKIVEALRKLGYEP